MEMGSGFWRDWIVVVTTYLFAKIGRYEIGKDDDIEM